MKLLTAALALCVCAFASTEVRIIPAGPTLETAKALSIPIPPGYKQTTFVTAITDDQKATGFTALVTLRSEEGTIPQVTVYHDFDHSFEGKRSGTAWADVDPNSVVEAFVSLVVETGETAIGNKLGAAAKHPCPGNECGGGHPSKEQIEQAKRENLRSTATCTSCTPHAAKPLRVQFFGGRR